MASISVAHVRLIMEGTGTSQDKEMAKRNAFCSCKDPIMKARAVLLAAAGALTIGSVLAAPAEATPRGRGGWGWHHHHYPHFALRHRYWGPVVYGYAAFPRCHWVRVPTGLMKVCNAYPY